MSQERVSISSAIFAVARPGWETLLSVAMLTSLFTATLVRRPASEQAPGTYFIAARPGPEPAARPHFEPLVGRAARYTARSGDTTLAVARAFNTDAVTLARLNHLTGKRLKPGQILRLPTLFILPREIQNGIVLNVPECSIYLFRKGSLVARYPVAVGKRTWETPIGVYRLVRKVINPTWLPPQVMVEREGVSTADIGPGRNNPIGDRWMGWSAPEVGFHSTFAVQSIGHLASHACVRMYPESAHHMFAVVSRGMPIYSLYEPIKIGKRDGDCYLSVSPDVYRYHKLSFALIMWRLEQLGIAGKVNRQRVRRILDVQDGYPYVIAHLDTIAE